MVAGGFLSLCPSLRDPDIDDEVLLDQSGSSDYRAVTFKRLTLVTDMEDSVAYHLRASQTFDCARDVTRRLLRSPDPVRCWRSSPATSLKFGGSSGDQ